MRRVRGGHAPSVRSAHGDAPAARRARGFTLIEVLVALAIAAIGLAAALSVVSNASRNAVSLRDRTVAGWVAANRVTETRLEPAFPSVDRTTGEVDMASQRWHWEQTVTQTQVPGLRRVDVRVRFATGPEDAWLSTVSGFVSRTQASAPAGGGSAWEGEPGAPAAPGGESP